MRSTFVAGPALYARHDAGSPTGLRALSALNRINALACIRAAGRGWLGGSFSVAELLTVLYFGLDERNVVLSKGHAAAMQYACLAGLGELPPEALLDYEDGPDAPQAHASIGTPGVLTNSGSLGQALSKVAGLAWARRDERFFVVLGDGELQEGQVFEGLQTVVARGLTNLVTIIDVNGFQTAARTDTIKPIPDLDGVLRGLGLLVRRVDGHDPAALLPAFASSARPLAVVADTVKAGGTELLPPFQDMQPWHGRVPDTALYRRLLSEQAALVGDPQLDRELEAWRPGPEPEREPSRSLERWSTGDAATTELEGLLDERPELAVLDADLSSSCGLGVIADPTGRFVARGQFFQMGIAEQDMVSFAGGLALAGRLPLVSTYAAFCARAIEQLRVNLSEGTRTLVTGHYAGLCYFTDGATHQSLGDLLLMQSLPGLLLLEPVTPEQARRQLRYAVTGCDRSVYLRLRRTPIEVPLSSTGPFGDDPLAPLLRGNGRAGWLVTAGTVATRLALDCLEEPAFEGWGVIAVSAFGRTEDPIPWRALLEGRPIVTIEENPRPGLLAPLLRELVPGCAPRCLFADGPGASFRTLDACRAHFGFTKERVRELAGG